MNDYADPLIKAKQNLKLLDDSLLHRKLETAKYAANAVKEELDRVIQWIEDNK
ncbi:MAG TPA: hypothetical protein VFM18_07930 [Methanosarcina sp.]|nr:hypothetical protein [Methanosarcina sp.]